MYNKPITQRVAFARSKKPSALKQTEDTTVLNVEYIPTVKDTATVKLPDTTETITTTKENPKLTEFKERCGKFGGKNSPEAAAAGCVWSDKAKDPEPITTTETITKPGGEGEAEAPQYMYDYGDSMPSWMQRKVERGLSQSARKTGKFAFKLAQDQEKLAALEKRGKTDSPKYAKLKARVKAREGALAAQKSFAGTQMEAARQGQMPGKKGTTKIPFDPNIRISGEEGTLARERTLSDTSFNEQTIRNQQNLQRQAAADAAANQEANAKRNAQTNTETTDVISTTTVPEENKTSPLGMKIGPLKMKSSFKMGGYGNKTYKK